jgi:hypothetical protein
MSCTLTKREIMTEYACDMNAMTADQRARYGALAAELFAGVRQTRELADGYAFRFDGDADTLLRLAEFVSLERLCCPFFRLLIEAQPGNAATVLHITGDDGEAIRAFIRAELPVSIG